MKTNFGRPEKYYFQQKLQFPRTLEVHMNGQLYVPEEIMFAQCEQAIYQINFDQTILANRLQGISHDAPNVGGIHQPEARSARHDAFSRRLQLLQALPASPHTANREGLMTGARLQKRDNSLFNRVNGMDRTVYLRTYTQPPSQDSLIGRSTDVASPSDTLISPQPSYKQLSARDVMYLTNAGRKVSADDYKVNFSPLAVTEAQLSDPTSMLVLEGQHAMLEVLRIVYVNTTGYQGSVALISVVARVWTTRHEWKHRNLRDSFPSLPSRQPAAQFRPPDPVSEERPLSSTQAADRQAQRIVPRHRLLSQRAGLAVCHHRHPQ